METIEQRSGVESSDAIAGFRFYRCAQIVEVAAHARGIEEQTVASGRDRVLAECDAENVDGEVEQPARAGQILFRPQHRHRPVARQRLRPRRDDESKQRDAMALRRWTADWLIPGPQTGAAE